MNSFTNDRQSAQYYSERNGHSKLDDTEYLAHMCHEIGTPLTAIIGFSHILSDVECSQQQKSECVHMLRDSSHMLMELLSNLLDSSKLESGRMKIEQRRFSLTQVIEETVHIITLKAEEKGLGLHIHIGDNLPEELIGDPLRIRQILLNLLSNAVKFTQNGQISIYLTASHESYRYCPVSITVADSGVGISETEIENIFDKYVQVNASVRRYYGGTGLGLSISRNLAHLMHGEITVKSWPGIGSHFTLTLPLRKILCSYEEKSHLQPKLLAACA